MKVKKVLKQILGNYYESASILFNDINVDSVLDIYAIHNYEITADMFFTGNASYLYKNISDVYPSDSIDKYKEYTYVIYNPGTKLFLNERLVFSECLHQFKYI